MVWGVTVKVKGLLEKPSQVTFFLGYFGTAW